MSKELGTWTNKLHVSTNIYGPGTWIALGISYYFNGFGWLTIGNGFLGWCYVAHRVVQMILG